MNREEKEREDYGSGGKEWKRWKWNCREKKTEEKRRGDKCRWDEKRRGELRIGEDIREEKRSEG